MENKKNYFELLYSVDVENKVKKKNGLSYISWAGAWAEVKKLHPTAIYKVYENENGRPWFDDGKTAWVKVSVEIENIEHIEFYPIMDFKNKAMVAESVTSTDANKAIQRGITKACARHGLGLHLYIGFEDTEENIEIQRLRDECMKLIKTKTALSDKASEEVKTVCMNADQLANGDPRLIEDIDVLKDLVKTLKGIRK